MLDIRIIRNEPERVKAELAKVGVTPAEVDALLDADRVRREALHAVETLRAERTAASKAIRDIKDPAEREQSDRGAAGRRRAHHGGRGHGRGRRRRSSSAGSSSCRTCRIPTCPSARRVGERRRADGGRPQRFDFTPLPHWDLGPRSASSTSSAGEGLGLALLRAARRRRAPPARAHRLDARPAHARATATAEVYPPAMVKREALVGTGNLPKFGENLYRDAEEDLWFVPTAEVPVTNLYATRCSTASAADPHVAYTPCFRREKMSAGRDVRGIKRGHQFDKVELVKFVRPRIGRGARLAAGRRGGRVPPPRPHVPDRPDVHRGPLVRRRHEVRHRGVGARAARSGSR
jgi:seryl-tRNA synthetase